MSLSGQWITRYHGSNSGRLVIELDEVDDHFEGTALIWDDVPDHFNAMVRIRTANKNSVQKIDDLPVMIIDNSGAFVSGETLRQLHNEYKVAYPATVNVNLELKGGVLHVDWTASHGGMGAGSALAPKTRTHQKPDIKVNEACTWDAFKTAVNRVDVGRYAFRGQESNEWRLRSSFHRTGRANMERYSLDDVAELHRIFSAISVHVFNLGDPLHYAAFLHLAQHHGYPTPLLDWSWSPYVAAFFAFERIGRHPEPTDKRKVRIFKFHAKGWNEDFSRTNKLFPIWPNVSVLNPLAFGNPRAIPQQAVSTISNIDDIESHITEFEASSGKTFLEAFDLSVLERETVMRELSLMGITAGSLFPGLDGACKALRERKF